MFALKLSNQNTKLSNQNTKLSTSTDTNRRKFLRNALTICAGSAVTTTPLPGIANSFVTGSDPLAGFIRVTQTITEHQHLDTTLAAYFYQAFAAGDRLFSGKIHQLQQLITPELSAENFLGVAKQQGLADFLLQIVTAWYTGTIGNDHTATLVAYKDAMMYNTVSDGLVVPTYCGNGPLWWTEAIPEADNPQFIATL